MSIAAIAAFWLAGEWPGSGPIPPAPGHVLYFRPGGLDTPPAASQAARLSLVNGIASTDGIATTLTLVHNFEMSSADLANGLPEVRFEVIEGAAYTERPFVVSKSENSVIVGFAADVAFSFGFQLDRPNTLQR